MACDHHVVALTFRNTRRDRAHTDFRHQLDADAGVWRHVLQVMDELRQVFDRINIVVGRGRNQSHTRHAVAQLANVIRHLATRQLAALTGLGALRHLDLDLVGRRQILGCHTEAARRHLFDA